MNAASGRIGSLGVHVVLYDDELERQRRLAAAIGAAVRHVRAGGGLRRVVLRFGDCSRWPCLPDGARDVLATAAGDGVDDVTVTFFEANLGSGGGSNALADQGREDVIWVLNPDTYPAPTALAELLAVLSLDGVAVAEGRQIPIEHQKAYDPATGETSWACGYSLLVRRDAFEQVGGFDDHFFPLYCDDVDLSWRLRAAGWSVRHVPRAVVLHDKSIGGDGSVRWSPTAARSSHLARLWLYRRYGRPDLEAEFLAAVDPLADPLAADAVDEFRSRVAAGDVPDRIDGAAAVATFADGQFAPRRFSYAP